MRNGTRCWLLGSAGSIVWMGLLSAAYAQDKAPDAELETITVTGTRGFATNVTQVGSFRGAHIVDTPATIQVLPKDVLDAQLDMNLGDILKNISGANAAQTSNIVASNQSIRGIPLDNRNGFRMDGSLPFINLIDMPVEDKERVEVLKGASGLYYGFAAPAGIINVTMKRPTREQLLDARVFGNGYGEIGGHLDVGNTLLDGKFGYRINAVYAHADPGIDHADGNRWLTTGTFDIRPLEQLSMQIDIEHIQRKSPEPGILRWTTLVAATPANPYPTLQLPNVKAIDPSINTAPSWAFYDTYETNALSHNVYAITEAWQVTLDAGISDFTRFRDFTTLQPTNLATGAGIERFQFSTQQNQNKNVRIETSGAFYTFDVKHEMSAGWQANQRDSYSVSTPLKACVNGIYTTSCQTGITSVGGIPVNFLNTAYLANMTRQYPGVFAGPVDRIDDAGAYIFDHMSWSNYVEVLAGGRFGNYNDYNIKPALIHNYHAVSKTTADAIVVKPFGNDNLDLYASYVEALEPGPGAFTTNVNAGQTLAPLPSLQREIGIKSEYFPGVLVQADWFDIRRGNAFVNALNYFVEGGQTKYDGFELNISGALTDHLQVLASGMLLMSKVISGAPTCGPGSPLGTLGGSCAAYTPTIVGLQISNTAKSYGSLFAEYKLDGLWGQRLDGLAFNAGAYFVGARPVDSFSHATLGSYTLYDLGASYQFEARYPMVLRIIAHNVGGLRYWAAGDADLVAYGQPQNVEMSLQVHF